MSFVNLMAYNQSVPQLWALNSGRISLSINGAVDLSTLQWCPTCGVCNEYVVMVDSFYMNRSTEINSKAMCFCVGSLANQDLINVINMIAEKSNQGPFNTIADAMTFAITEGIFITNQNYPYIPTLNNELFLDGGLPASYPLFGNLWYDLTGNQNNGTLQNGVTYDVALKGSLVFNGTNQYVTFNSPVDIPIGNSSYTINVWFNPDVVGDRGLVGWGDYSTTNQSNYVRLTNTGIIHSWTNNDLSINAAITPGSWNNVIVKYDGTTRQIWLNGVLMGQDTPVGHNTSSSSNLTVGLTNTGQYFDGKISLVQVFTRALSESEIQSSFLNFKTRYDGTDSALCVTPTFCTRTPTRTPTQTPSITASPTTTPTQTPTSPRGQCWSVTEQYGNYSYVKYLDVYGNEACATVGPYATVYLCIFPGSENFIQGFEEPQCTGNGVDYHEQNLYSQCDGFQNCIPTPTPTPTIPPPTPTPTVTPTNACLNCGESKSGSYSGEDYYMYPEVYLCDLGTVTNICYRSTDSTTPYWGEIDTNNGSYGTTTNTIYVSNYNFNNTINYTAKYSALVAGDNFKVTIGVTEYFFIVTSVTNNGDYQTIGVTFISATGPNQTPQFNTEVCVYFESAETANAGLSWVEIDRPNRFNVYSNIGLVGTSGWVGFATYSGPWGTSLDNPGPDIVRFTYNPAHRPYYVITEAGPADPSAPINDFYSYTVLCDVPPIPPPIPDPTPSQTPSPTPIKYTLTIKASLEDIPECNFGDYPIETASRVYRVTGTPTVQSRFLLGGNIASTSCNFLTKITNITPGTSISLGVLGWSSNRDVSFTIHSGECDGPILASGCGALLIEGGGGAASVVVNSNMTISVVTRVMDCIKSLSTSIKLPPPPVPFCQSCPGYNVLAPGTWTQYDKYSCYKKTEVPATNPITPLFLMPVKSNTWGISGTKFYEKGFDIEGTGTTVAVSSTVPLWKNNPLSEFGPLNRCGVWTTVPGKPTNTWVGFSTCLTGTVNEKTYWVGIAADSDYKIVIDGVEIVDTYTIFGGTSLSFDYWHVYPVSIGAGTHTIELYGLNRSGSAGFGCEIYDNTITQLITATNYNQLNVVFTSSGKTFADVVQTEGGQYITSGYTCPTEYVYSKCDDGCISYEYCEVVIPKMFIYCDPDPGPKTGS